MRHSVRRLSWILIIVGLFVVFQYTQIGVMRQFQDLLSLNARAAPSANIQIEAIEEIVKRVTLGDSEIAIHVASIPLAGPGRILVLDGTALPGTSQQTRISNSELKGLVGQNQILFDGKVSDAMPAPFRFKQTNYEAQPRYYWYFLGSNYAKIRITQGGLGPEAKASATLMPSGYALDSRRPHTLWSATAATAPSRGHRAAVVGPIAAAHCAPRGDGSG